MPDVDALISETRELLGSGTPQTRSGSTRRRLGELRRDLRTELDRLEGLADAGGATVEQLSQRRRLADLLNDPRFAGITAAPVPPAGGGSGATGPTTRLEVPDLPDGASRAAKDLAEQLRGLYDAFEHFPAKPDEDPRHPDSTAWRGEMDRLMVAIAHTEARLLFELGGGIGALDTAKAEQVLDGAVRDIAPELQKAAAADVRLRDAEQKVHEALGLIGGSAEERNIWGWQGMGDGPQGMLRMLLVRLYQDADAASQDEARARTNVRQTLTAALDAYAGLMAEVMQRGRDALGDSPLVEHTVPSPELRKRVRAALGQLALDQIEGTDAFLDAATEEGNESYLFPERDGLAPLPQEGLRNEPPEDEGQSAVPGSSGLPVGALVAVAVALVVVLGLVALLIGSSSDDDGGGGSDDQAVDVDVDGGEVGPGAAAVATPAALGILGAPDSIDALVVSVDPEGGISWSITDQAGATNPSSQISRTYAVLVRWSPELLAALFNSSSLPCGLVTDEVRVTCPPGAGPLAEEDHVVVGVELEGPVGEGATSFTYGLAFDGGDPAVDYVPQPPFDADFFAGTEVWYRLEIDADGTRAVRADGFVDGVPDVPRASSATAIEVGDTLLWVVPRSEVPADALAYRATAFHDDGPDAAVPDPATSGGDVSGSGVDEPLLAVDGDAVAFDATDGLLPDAPAPLARVPIGDDPDAHIAQVLVRGFETRLAAALAEGPDAVVALIPQPLLDSSVGEACRAEAEATIVQADAVTITALPSGPDTSRGIPAYLPEAEIAYPTGTVAWQPLLVPGPGARLYLVLPSCIG